MMGSPSSIRATDRNEHLVAILRALSLRVDDEDRAVIESALNDSDVDGHSPDSSSASKTSHVPTSPFLQRHSLSQISPSGTSSTFETEGTLSAIGRSTSLVTQESNYDLESLLVDASPTRSGSEAVYLGQMCEVQWLRNLKARLHVRDTTFPVSSMQSGDTNFYLDDDGIQPLYQELPFHMPPQEVAMALMQCYLHTVQDTYPMVQSDLENQLQIYYHSMRNAHPVNFPHRWYAILNVVFAIGSRFSRLTGAEWQADALDESLFISRAIQNLECLLSSLTGRPSMIQSEQVTTPLPSTVTGIRGNPESHYTISMSYSDAQMRIAIITQRVLSNLYTERRADRSWAQMHIIMTSMMRELDEWAMEAAQQQDQKAQLTSGQEKHQVMLRKQYLRTKILITRPSLGRIERCAETGSEDFTRYDQETAEACIKTAQEVASSLPQDMDLNRVYEQGPWWTISHHIMQALTILLIAISCRKHFEPCYTSSVASANLLITWLRLMRDHNNDTAKRAYTVVHNLLRAPDAAHSFVWAHVAPACPPDDLPRRTATLPVQQEQQEQQQQEQGPPAGDAFLPYPAHQTAVQRGFEFPEGWYAFPNMWDGEGVNEAR
ncbi:hypothetical protein ACEQ8H_007936 [Pleosporales sp. CAS-2024a]